MNKFKKAAGLLNDKAPQGEFLAYINPKEADILKVLGGLGKDINGTGVPSYVDFGGGGSGYGSAQDSFDSASGNSNSGSSRSDSGGSYDDSYAQSVATNTAIANSQNSTFTTDDSDDDQKALSYVNFDPNAPNTILGNIGDSNDERVGLLANALRIAKVPYDLLKGNLPTSVLSLLGNAPENQYAGITGEDIYETPSQYAQDVLNIDYEALDLENQRSIDKEYFDQGYRTDDFKNFYSGENSDISKFTQPEQDAYNKIISYAPYIQSGTEAPQQSMVNDYFSNIGNQSGLSSDLEKDYNAAKANVANTMAITPLADQFGYSSQPYGLLTRQNLSANLLNIPYLQSQGLI